MCYRDCFATSGLQIVQQLQLCSIVRGDSPPTDVLQLTLWVDLPTNLLLVRTIESNGQKAAATRDEQNRQ